MKLSQNFRTLTPAYGRDYKGGNAAVQDFNAGKDFVLQPEGALINIEQIEKGVTVNLRFNNLRTVRPVKVL